MIHHPGTRLFTSIHEQLAACSDLNFAVRDLDKEADSPDRLEDAHIGEWVADNYLTDFLYTGGLGWMRYDGCRWKSVEETTVSEVIRQTLIGLQYSEAQKSTDNLPRLQQITRMLSANKIRSITFVAKLRKHTEKIFDNHPDLLNVRNGVVDLKTGGLLKHDPGLMFTKVTPVDYVPNAVHQDWRQALDAVPQDAREWLQVRMGQGLTGYPVPDDRLVVLKGGGSNGKSTILDGIRAALGEYAVALPDRVLLARPGDHPTELMVLRGARLAFMEEFPEMGHLNVKRLKDLFGTDEMTGRYVHKDSVSWKVSHTIFVTTNYLPRVDESDDGTWRRLVLLDFPYRYLKSHEAKITEFDRAGDPNLRDRLRRGQDGQPEAVLAWLVNGAVKWYQSGQVMPEDPRSVREATEAWRSTSDLLLSYISERLIFDQDSHVMATELLADFNGWLKDSGHREWSSQTFDARFTQHRAVTDHQVTKKPGIRPPQPGLSRLSRGVILRGVATGEQSKQYRGWLGLRFRDGKSE